jgi:DNA polymerase
LDERPGAVGEDAALHRWKSIDEVKAEAVVCCRCDLCQGRTRVVFGEGPVPARLMVIGEAPGVEEDKVGRPFVGRAGSLLNDVLSSAGVSRDDLWVTNVVRCRATRREGEALRNRAPRPDEIRACDLWMEQEYRFVMPTAVVCLGGVAARSVISRGFRINESRGVWFSARNDVFAIATFHPSYISRFRTAEREGAISQMISDFRSAADRAFSG